MTYTVILKTPHYEVRDYGWHRSIVCFFCYLESHHPHDVSNRYCGHCHRFHDD